MTLIPAYGRDYKSAKEVKAAVDANKDFQVASMFDGGGYTSKDELKNKGVTSVVLRYKKLTQVTSHKVK
jgi:hypothetical protein